MDMENMQPQSQAKSKVIWYVIGGLVILGIVGYTLAHLAGFGGNGIKYNTNSTQTYSNSDGQVTVGTSAMPANWPSDAPANYSGAKILFSGNSNPQTGQSGAAVSYTLQNVSVQAVADYYQAQLTAKGWKIEGNANMGGQMIVGAKKDTRNFVVSILDNGNGTVTVTAGLELQ